MYQVTSYQITREGLFRLFHYKKFVHKQKTHPLMMTLRECCSTVPEDMFGTVNYWLKQLRNLIIFLLLLSKITLEKQSNPSILMCRWFKQWGRQRRVDWSWSYIIQCFWQQWWWGRFKGFFNDYLRKILLITTPWCWCRRHNNKRKEENLWNCFLINICRKVPHSLF